MNISPYAVESTASTCTQVAYQRADALSALGCRQVLECCIGIHPRVIGCTKYVDIILRS